MRFRHPHARRLPLHSILAALPSTRATTHLLCFLPSIHSASPRQREGRPCPSSRDFTAHPTSSSRPCHGRRRGIPYRRAGACCAGSRAGPCLGLGLRCEAARGLETGPGLGTPPGRAAVLVARGGLADCAFAGRLGFGRGTGLSWRCSIWGFNVIPRSFSRLKVLNSCQVRVHNDKIHCGTNRMHCGCFPQHSR